jgi:hypothetical protein
MLSSCHNNRNRHQWRCKGLHWIRHRRKGCGSSRHSSVLCMTVLNKIVANHCIYMTSLRDDRGISTYIRGSAPCRRVDVGGTRQHLRSVCPPVPCSCFIIDASLLRESPLARQTLRVASCFAPALFLQATTNLYPSSFFFAEAFLIC